MKVGRSAEGPRGTKVKIVEQLQSISAIVLMHCIFFYHLARVERQNGIGLEEKPKPANPTHNILQFARCNNKQIQEESKNQE